MKFKSKKCLLIIAVLSTLLTGCWRSNHMRNVKKDELLLFCKSSYYHICDIPITNASIENNLRNTHLPTIIDSYGINFIRQCGNMFYIVFRTPEKWILLQTSEMINCEEQSYEISDIWIFGLPIMQNDFLSFNEKTSIHDVKKIDPDGEYVIDFNTGRLPFSRHKTIDGWEIEVTYSPATFQVLTVDFNELTDSFIDVLSKEEYEYLITQLELNWYGNE